MKFESIHFARPDMLIVVIVITAITCLLSWYRLKKITYVVDLLDGSVSHKNLRNYSYIKKIIKAVLWCISVASLATVLMRPQWNDVASSVKREGRDVFIALDISRSMLAQDLKPDRLVFAKEKIKKLVKRLKTDRVGLILFSGSTFVQCPLTDDLDAFYMFLDGVDAETISSGTTALDAAINQAIEVFSTMPERKSKLLVMFTDGEDFSSNLTTVKKKAASLGLHIVTVGVGTDQGAPIPLYDKLGKPMGHQLDAKGSVVISRMNEGILYRIAQDTGGIFVPIAQNATDIKKIESFIGSFEKELLNDKQVKQFQEQYYWPLLVAFITLAIEWML